jgi:hypothetical protein
MTKRDTIKIKYPVIFCNSLKNKNEPGAILQFFGKTKNHLDRKNSSTTIT